VQDVLVPMYIRYIHVNTTNLTLHEYLFSGVMPIFARVGLRFTR
jgi:hypothetical protein